MKYLLSIYVPPSWPNAERSLKFVKWIKTLDPKPSAIVVVDHRTGLCPRHSSGGPPHVRKAIYDDLSKQSFAKSAVPSCPGLAELNDIADCYLSEVKCSAKNQDNSFISPELAAEWWRARMIKLWSIGQAQQRGCEAVLFLPFPATLSSPHVAPLISNSPSTSQTEWAGLKAHQIVDGGFTLSAAGIGSLQDDMFKSGKTDSHLYPASWNESTIRLLWSQDDQMRKQIFTSYRLACEKGEWDKAGSIFVEMTTLP
jgi:hypothetical protein